MEKTRIGLNAGKVWRILNEKGELSMFDLLLAKVETNVHLRWESALLSTRLKI